MELALTRNTLLSEDPLSDIYHYKIEFYHQIYHDKP